MRYCWLIFLATISLVGCDSPPSGSMATSAEDSAPPPPPDTLSPSEPPLPPSSESTGHGSATGNQGEYDSNSYEREVAQVGVGKKGRGYGGGLVSEPIRQKFRIEQRVVFLKIQSSLNQFKALNGRLPESHDEFMTAIVKEGGVTLPELPTGERYVYDPEQGELMVERPKSR